MTTTTTPTTPTTTTPLKRPLTLTLAVALLALMALLAFASPFLPRGRTFGFGGQRQPPAGGWQRPDGQPGANDPGVPPGDGQRQLPADQNGQRGQQSGGGWSGNPGGGNNQGQTGQFQGPRNSSAMMMMRLAQPLQTGIGVVVGLLALIAALGLWRQKRWGMILTLIAAVISLLTAMVTFVVPLFGRAAFWLIFLTSATWQAVVGIVLAVLVTVLVLLPASRRGYVVEHKERRVM